MKFMWINIVGWSLSTSIAIIGWWIAITNLNKQHRRNLDLDNQKFKREMQIKTADEAIKLLAKSREALGELNLYLILLPGDLKMRYAVNFETHLKRWDKPNEQVLQLWDNASKIVFEFTYFFESREIVLNQFLDMKQVILDKMSDIRPGVSDYSQYVGSIYYSKYLSRTVLVEDEFTNLEIKTKEFNEHVYDLLSYIHDFNIELQNTFLSKTFGYSIPERQPTDPKYKVLRSKKEGT